MVLFVFLFFIFGLFAILLETFTPHGVSAFLGMGMIGLSCYLAFRFYGMHLGVLYCVMALSIAVIVARFAIVTSFNSMALKPKGKRAGSDAVALAGGPVQPRPGDDAVVIQPLRPTGTIEVHGHRLPARAIYAEREIAAGAEVILRSKDSVYWLVEEKEGDAVKQGATAARG